MEANVHSARVLESGQVVDSRFEIIERIATGGMATVYRAIDRQNGGMELALKVLHKDLCQDKSYVQRFVREVKLTNGLKHPNLVRSFDIGTEDGMIYYTMEFIRGHSLEELMAERSFSTEEISRIILDVCRGLEVIHNLGIVHRDLKPGNVLIGEDGTAKIVDFGVARDKTSRLTQPGQTIGSICYIAPEIWLGRTPTPAADFYGLGIMLYELVTGDVPFDNPLPGQMLELHLKGVIEPPWKRNPSVPRWLGELIMKLLEKQPRERPRSARTIIQLVETALSRAGVSANGQAVVRDDRLAPFVETAPPVKEHVPTADEPVLKHVPITPVRLNEREHRGKTYVFRLSATQVFEEAALQEQRPRRKATVVIPLPKRAALVLEVDRPSRDVIAFGVFLGSLQILDGALTTLGVRTWGLHAEGNPLLRALMHFFGPENAIIFAKCFAIIGVVFLTNLARKKRFFRDLIGAMTCLYLVAAILPWVYFLSRHFAHQ